MVLRKRYRRDIRHNLSLYVSAAFITVLSLMLFYLYDICGNGILNYANNIFESQKVEDANFSTYIDIPEEELEMYEKQYDLELEKQEYLNLKTNGVTSRVYEKTEKIDIPFITEGRDVQEDDEIVISEGYALNNKIEIGDTVQIQSKTYEVTGYVERPDYLVMYENLGDATKNLTSFYICYMTENAFENLGKANSQYLVRYTKDNNKEFRKNINDIYYLNSYVASQDNMKKRKASPALGTPETGPVKNAGDTFNKTNVPQQNTTVNEKNSAQSKSSAALERQNARLQGKVPRA